MKDLRGVDRGACNNCGECDDFIRIQNLEFVIGKVRCDYCDCAAAKPMCHIIEVYDQVWIWDTNYINRV